MKICLYADNHYSQYSSIVRKRGNRYSHRLENQIASLDWVESLAAYTGCDEIVCLGDFFDKSQLNSEEITALQEITFDSNIMHTFIVGNHEMLGNYFSSAHLFTLSNNFQVVDQVMCKHSGKSIIYYIPYILECNREELSKYFIADNKGKQIIVLTHNDIKGIQMGQFVSKEGFDIDDISQNCDLFINGHLHNGQAVTNKIINLGNLTGQNFSEDASRWAHCAAVLDTETLHIDYYENPCAYNFYKMNLTLVNRDVGIAAIDKLKNNAVVTAKVYEKDYDYFKAYFNECADKIEAFKLIIESEEVVNSSDDSIEDLLSIDHIEQFKVFCSEQLGNSDIVLQELAEVTK